MKNAQKIKKKKISNLELRVHGIALQYAIDNKVCPLHKSRKQLNSTMNYKVFFFCCCWFCFFFFFYLLYGRIIKIRTQNDFSLFCLLFSLSIEIKFTHWVDTYGWRGIRLQFSLQWGGKREWEISMKLRGNILLLVICNLQKQNK